MTTSEPPVPGDFTPPLPPLPPPPRAPYIVPAAVVPPSEATTPLAPGHAVPGSPAHGSPAHGYPASGYPAPGYAAPGYPAPGYPAQAYPATSYPASAPPRGLLPWVLGFLIFLPIPFLGGLVSGIAMAVSGGSSLRAGGPARENARAALNWGITYVMVSTLLLLLHFVVLFALTAQTRTTGFFPIGIPITIYLALSLLHVVIVIIGTVRSSSGRVVRVPFAIPFLRA